MSKKTKRVKPAKQELMYNQEQVNALVKTLSANEQKTEGMRKRLTSAISGGYDNADTLHNIFLDYGYPDELDFTNFWNMYRRFGIAKNVVELKPDTCWITPPEIETGSEQFNRDFKYSLKRKSSGCVRRVWISGSASGGMAVCLCG